MIEIRPVCNQKDPAALSGASAAPKVKTPVVKVSEVKTPVVKVPEVKVPEVKVPEVNVPDMNINKFQVKDERTLFTTIFPYLDSTTQQSYLEKLYQNDNFTFLGWIIAHSMDQVQLLSYAKKAKQDNKTSIYDDIINILNQDGINSLAKAYYKADDLTSFSDLVPHMSSSIRKGWIAKAKKDAKHSFSSVLKKK